MKWFLSLCLVVDKNINICSMRKPNNIKYNQKALCLQFFHQSVGLLTFAHVHTGCLWFVWASERHETLLNSRHFVNFAAVVLQVGLSELHPHSWAPHRTYSDCSEGFACVHVRVCTCVFTQECGFLLYPPSVAFLWGIFPDSFPRCYEKPNTSCFVRYDERPLFVVKRVCLVRVAKFKQIDLSLSCNCCFSSKETSACRSRKLNLCVSCKIISSCLKHKPKGFKGNNLTS